MNKQERLKCAIIYDILRNSAPSFDWLSSSIFNVHRSFVIRPTSVTPPLISTNDVSEHTTHIFSVSPVYCCLVWFLSCSLMLKIQNRLHQDYQDHLKLQETTPLLETSFFSTGIQIHDANMLPLPDVGGTLPPIMSQTVLDEWALSFSETDSDWVSHIWHPFCVFSGSRDSQLPKPRKRKWDFE